MINTNRLVRMFDSVVSVSPASHALTQLTDAVDELIALDLSQLHRDELLDLLRGLETQRHRLPVADHHLITELDQRGTAGEMGARDTRTLLREILRLSPHQAKARAKQAVDLGPRTSITGQPRPPLFPAVAAAQAAGDISIEHAKVITDAVDALPAAAQAEHAAAVEQRLVVEAQRFDPVQLATLARRISAHLDPDGVLTADADHQRRRSATLHANHDGSGELCAHLSPAALAVWQAVLDPLAAPAPTADGSDLRSPAQRRHDALLDAGQRLLRSGALPAAGGVPATVIITMTLRELETRAGFAATAHGGLLTIDDALQLADQAHAIPTVLNNTGAVLAYGRTRRLASPSQRLALTARDRGCSFPCCDVPASWCEAHHVIPWANGGRTDLTNLTLLCGYHHREFQQRGWTITMQDGLPWWTPPPRIDPTRTPLRNTMHLTGVP